MKCQSICICALVFGVHHRGSLLCYLSIERAIIVHFNCSLKEQELFRCFFSSERTECTMSLYRFVCSKLYRFVSLILIMVQKIDLMWHLQISCLFSLFINTIYRWCVYEYILVVLLGTKERERHCIYVVDTRCSVSSFWQYNFKHWSTKILTHHVCTQIWSCGLKAYVNISRHPQKFRYNLYLHTSFVCFKMYFYTFLLATFFYFKV